jgi:hypothetical protein
MQGQFIYTKYAFENLTVGKTMWTLAELEAVLPSGLGGMYHHILKTLCGALTAERPELLFQLRQSLLPVLAMVEEPMTVPELAWAVGGDVKEVCTFVLGHASI